MRYIAWVNTAPEHTDPKLSNSKKAGRLRSKDIEEVLGEVPMPNEAWKHPLVNALFEVGPLSYDGFVTWQELRSWQEVVGIDLDPWEACAILDMSKAFLNQKSLSSSFACLCPWPQGQKMWQYVSGKLQEKQKEAEALKKSKEKEPHGSHKRHRNPPKG